MNETMNIVENVTEEVLDTTTEVTPIDCQSTEGSRFATAVKFVVFGVITGGVILFANRKKLADKIDARQIKRLTKRGYVCHYNAEVYTVEEDHGDFEEVAD